MCGSADVGSVVGVEQKAPTTIMCGVLATLMFISLVNLDRADQIDFVVLLQ